MSGATEFKPISSEYLDAPQTVARGSRLHRLVCRLADTYIDDLTDERIFELERLADSFRLTHADGVRFEPAR